MVSSASDDPTKIIQDTAGERPGYDALWLYFGLSRASFLTLPRVLMHEMPDEWQATMARLLDEYHETWVNWPDGIGTRVTATECGKIIKTPDWIIQYRHPDYETIAKLRSPAVVPRERHD